MCLREYPDVRESIFRYYTQIGYSRGRFNQIVSYISESCLDDASLFQACKLITDWVIPNNVRNEVVGLAHRLLAEDHPISFVCSIWLLAKYGTPSEVAKVIQVGRGTWRNNSFCARQVAAITPRLSDMPNELHGIERILRTNGQYEAVRVLDNLAELSSLSAFTKDERRYISPATFNPPYPLYKVLICMALLRSKAPEGERTALRAAATKVIGDLWYERLLAEVPA